MLSIVRVSARNQITVPQDVRDAIQCEPGDRIAFRTDENGRVYVDSLRNVNPNTLRGVLKRSSTVQRTADNEFSKEGSNDVE